MGRRPVALRGEQPQDFREQQAGVGAAHFRRLGVASEDPEAGKEGDIGFLFSLFFGTPRACEGNKKKPERRKELTTTTTSIFSFSFPPPPPLPQIAAVDPANGIAADILVRDGCLVTACGQDPNPLVCVPKAISAISASSSVAGGGLQDAVECLTKFCSLDAKLAGEVRACVSRKPLVPQELAACVAGVHKG